MDVLPKTRQGLDAKLAVTRESNDHRKDLEALSKLLALNEIRDLEIQYLASGNPICALEGFLESLDHGLAMPPWVEDYLRSSSARAVQLEPGKKAKERFAEALGFPAGRSSRSVFGRRELLRKKLRAAKRVRSAWLMCGSKELAYRHAGILEGRESSTISDWYAELESAFDQAYEGSSWTYRRTCLDRLVDDLESGWTTPGFEIIPEEKIREFLEVQLERLKEEKPTAREAQLYDYVFAWSRKITGVPTRTVLVAWRAAYPQRPVNLIYAEPRFEPKGSVPPGQSDVAVSEYRKTEVQDTPLESLL